MHTVLHWDVAAEGLAATSQCTNTSLHAVLIFAEDPIDGINNGSPVRPDIERPSIRDYWQESLQQQQRKKPTDKKQNQNQKDKRRSPHRIDDFA